MIRVKGLGSFLASVVALGLVIGLFGFSASLNPIDVLLGRGRQIVVPDLTGMSLPRARTEAKRVGLIHKTREAYSLTVPRGSIIRQEPTGGSHARVGSSLELTVSLGENSAPMPDAVGKQLDDVRGPLDDAGIEVAAERVYSETVDAGVVLSQSPTAGTVLRGSEVARFTVSRGAEERPVPDVRGMKTTGAGFLLGQAGFQIGEVVLVDDANVVPGSVASTDPPIGTVTGKGTAITIEVSAGPAVTPVMNVVGQTADAARRTLSSVGFSVQTSSSVLAAGDPSIGKVLAQYPAADEQWRPSMPVTIVVGTAPPTPPPTTTTTTTTTPPPDPADPGSITPTTRAPARD